VTTLLKKLLLDLQDMKNYKLCSECCQIMIIMRTITCIIFTEHDVITDTLIAVLTYLLTLHIQRLLLIFFVFNPWIYTTGDIIIYEC